MKAAQRLQNILTPTVVAMGYEVVGCVLGNAGHRQVLRVYVDSKDGVTLETCAKISRQISAVLDVADPINGRYDLEVSSPGVERPLLTLAHYQRFVGCQVRCWCHGEGRHWRGVIQAVEGEAIVFQVADTIQRVPFNKIEKAHLVFEH